MLRDEKHRVRFKRDTRNGSGAFLKNTLTRSIFPIMNSMCGVENELLASSTSLNKVFDSMVLHNIIKERPNTMLPTFQSCLLKVFDHICSIQSTFNAFRQHLIHMNHHQKYLKNSFTTIWIKNSPPSSRISLSFCSSPSAMWQTPVLCVTLNGQFFQMLGSDTSHTAIEAIEGLNLPGVGEIASLWKTN